MDTTNEEATSDAAATSPTGETVMPTVPDGRDEEFDLDNALAELRSVDPADAPDRAEAVAEHLTAMLHGTRSGDGIATA